MIHTTMYTANTIYLKVAEHVFAIRTDKHDAMLRRMERNYSPFIIPDGGGRLLFSIDIDRRTTFPAGDPVKTFRYMLASDNAELRIYPDRYLLSILNVRSGRTFSAVCPMETDCNGQYRFHSDLTIQGIAPPSHILDHLLIFAFSVASVSYDTLLIHASTIVHGGKAVMFLGESGTGKSTHSRMWLENIPGTSLLNDDAPAVRAYGDGRVTAFGTPWSGKTPCYKNESYPLAALVRIKRAPYNELSRQSSLHAFSAVLPSSLPTMQQDERLLDATCAAISTVLSSTPVYVMECLPDADAARTAHKGLFRS